MTILLNFNNIDESFKNIDIEIDVMKRNIYTYDDYNVKGKKTENFCGINF